jgi:hypothetical protein
MNNTKWEEVHRAMYALGDLHPKWRTKILDTGYVSSWDDEWFYHFKDGGYDDIEWAEIKVASPEQSVAVLIALKAIHLPGERTDAGFKIYGHLPVGKVCGYL